MPRKNVSPELRAQIQSMYSEGKSAPEIASALGVKEHTVYWHTRALTKHHPRKSPVAPRAVTKTKTKRSNGASRAVSNSNGAGLRQQVKRLSVQVKTLTKQMAELRKQVG